MTMSVSATTLLAYFNAKSAAAGEAAASAASKVASTVVPTAPWNAASSSSSKSTSSSTSSSTAATAALGQATSLAESLLAGGTKLINPTSAKLSVSTTNAKANSDYQNLFALYQGLTSLQTLANAASTSGLPSATLTQLQSAFSSGLSQVQSFLTSSPFKQFQVGDGTVGSSDQTTAGAPEETDIYTTGLSASSTSTVLPQLQGEMSFSMTVQTLNGGTTTVPLGLGGMDAPRTLSNVISYLNGQLESYGVKTRFSDKLVTTTTPASGSSSSSSSTTSSSFALTITGTPLETISFSADDEAASVLVGQTSTEPTLAATSSSGSSSTAATPTTVSQLLNFDPSGAQATNSAGEIWSQNLPSGASVQATATASDGSTYVLANVSGSVNGQSIDGSQDAALLKYDSAGNLVYTRTLGAASSASGYSLAVSPDGTQVAVAGSVTGGLDPSNSQTSSSTTEQSFVTVYGSATGDELWSQTQDADVDNQATGVAFGSDNTVYVSGSVDGSLTPGQISNVTEQGYLQTYSASSTTDKGTGETTWTAKPTSTVQYGAAGVSRATGVAVSGTNVYVSSVENGDATVREYDASSGKPTLAAEQDLGNLDGGAVSAIALGSNGSIYVAGSTHNGSLNVGSVTNAYAGNGDGFVAQLSSGLDSSSSSVAYLNNGDTTTATGLAVTSNGVYVTGQTATGSSTTGAGVSELGYAAELDTSGQVAWSQTFKGAEGNAAPVSISVDSTGSSSLDAMGLPTGTIAYTTSNALVANSSVRAGDSFYVQVGSGAATQVTIAADDTYSTLAKKIEQASAYQLTATTTTDSNGGQELKITPSSTSSQAQVSIEAGPAGADALSALGLDPGLITNASTTASASSSSSTKASTNSLKAAYAIGVPTTLSLGSASDIAAAQSQIASAIAQVKSIYSAMSTPTSTTGASSTNSAMVSYQKTLAAQYSSALSRLVGASSTSSTSTNTLASLF